MRPNPPTALSKSSKRRFNRIWPGVTLGQLLGGLSHVDTAAAASYHPNAARIPDASFWLNRSLRALVAVRMRGVPRSSTMEPVIVRIWPLDIITVHARERLEERIFLEPPTDEQIKEFVEDSIEVSEQAARRLTEVTAEGGVTFRHHRKAGALLVIQRRPAPFNEDVLVTVLWTHLPRKKGSR